MALPIIPLLSAGSTLISTILGNNAAKKQQNLAEQQLAQQQALSQQQQNLAEKMAQLGLATTVDGNGNITAYDPATNTWRTILAPEQQALQNLSDQELKQALSIDAPVNRTENLINAIRRSREGSTADGMLLGIQDQLKGTTAVRGADLASSLRLSREKAVNDGFDTISNNLGTQALRSGITSGGALAGALAKQRSQTLAQTMGNPDLEGIQLADEINQSRTGNSFNLYNAMAGRAAGAPIQSFNPVGISQQLTNSLNTSRSAAQLGAGGAGSLYNSASSILKGNTLPDYASTSGSSIFSAISNLLGSGALNGVFGDRSAKSSSGGWKTSTSKGPVGGKN